jgi:hypothetical protein
MKQQCLAVVRARTFVVTRFPMSQYVTDSLAFCGVRSSLELPRHVPGPLIVALCHDVTCVYLLGTFLELRQLESPPSFQQEIEQHRLNPTSSTCSPGRISVRHYVSEEGIPRQW